MHVMDDSKSESEREVVWSKGELCKAPYSKDNKLYTAKVTSIKRNGRTTLACVHFIGYDSVEDEDIPISKLHKIPSKKKVPLSKSGKSGVEDQDIESSSTLDSGFFSPLKGNEEERRLREKFAALDAEEEEQNTLSTPSKRRQNWTSLSSPYTLNVSLSQKQRKKAQKTRVAPYLESTGNKGSGRRRKGVVAAGGEPVMKNRKSSKPSDSTENLIKLHDPHHTTEKNFDQFNEDDSVMDDMTNDGFEMKGFSEEDLEKPHFTYPPLGAKEDYSLSDSGDPDAVKIPATVNQYLREYQREGVQFLYTHYKENRGAILGDDMGLGKTVQVIAFLSAILNKTGTKADIQKRRPRFIRRMSSEPSLSPEEDVSPAFLIIAPGTVLYNWLDELETWGYFSVGKFHGSEKERTMADLKRGKLELVITTFETFRDNIDTVNDFPWTAVFVDEVHKIKGLKARVTSALRKVNTKRRFGLTGTALQNNLQEFWCILDWANPGCLGDLQTFEKDCILKIELSQRHDATKRELAEGRKCKQKVAAIKNKYMLRRTKNLLLDQLPSKEDLVVYCKLTDMQTDIYKAILNQPDVVYILTQGDPCECSSGRTRGHCCYEKIGDQDIRSLTLTYMHLLLKVANHVALLVPDGSTSSRQVSYAETICNIVFENYPQFLQQDKWARFDTLSNPKYCGKMKVLVGILSVCAKNKSKVLLFSYSTRLLTIVEHFVMSKGYDYRRIDGMVANKQRFEFTQQFNKDPNIFLCLISTKAGGLGLNLTGANVVVIYDPNWNPTYDLQAQDRAYRIGQRRDVKVYRLISQGTIEENIYLRQIYKQQLDSVTISEENARRYFTAVQGDGTRKGELFGVGNMFQLRTGDGCLTADILQRNSRLEKGLAGFQCYKYLAGQGSCKSEEVKMADTTPSCLDDSVEEEASADTIDLQEIVGEMSDLEPDSDVPDSNGLDFVCSQVVDSNCERTPCGSRILSGDHESGDGAFDTQPSTSVVKPVKRTPGTKISSSKSRDSKKCIDITNSSDSEGEGQKAKAVKKKVKRAVVKNKRNGFSDAESSLNSISDVLEHCGVVHTHQNKKVVGTSKAEDHMSRCAMKDVFELHQNSQEPAINCEPLQNSEEEKAHVDVPKKRRKDKKQDGPRKEVIGNLQVLIGQTPKSMKLQHFTNMCKFFHGSSAVAFAKTVLSSSHTERQTMLKDFYTSKHPELMSSSLFKVTATKDSTESVGESATVRTTIPKKERKGKKQTIKPRYPQSRGKSKVKKGCTYDESENIGIGDNTTCAAAEDQTKRKTFTEAFEEFMGHEDMVEAEPSKVSPKTNKVQSPENVQTTSNASGHFKKGCPSEKLQRPLPSMSVLDDFFKDDEEDDCSPKKPPPKSKAKPPPQRKHYSVKRQNIEDNIEFDFLNAKTKVISEENAGERKKQMTLTTLESQVDLITQDQSFDIFELDKNLKRK
ncbi:DNA excision repair protein ERCC-6-like 2 isoform X1 [Lingula anatina]|uniref:DNA excision repair protein ERCC-6-like 2 isoform X1 n=1 Tax=Lingula anatina TaxID=7574 RepID=A0A1S3I6D0_LINAN|nr:DNA excision repair protein ERCC-6-like 2 isoform X1 [Lingula anatina]XP_013393763.1 DNA excision repair protein ERCC-6-like 2 isoform X1 [Lingula anatina]|eukprot:XP_013393762.1 DNA excision repair protein ERCC-6-like 2 isoform X1 [Lingula anatina]